MFDEPKPSHTEILVEAFGGFVVGVIAGAVISVGGLLLLGALLSQADKGGFVAAEILDLALLALVGYLVLRRDYSPFRNGFLTGLSLAFILNALCGVAILGH